MSRKILPPGKEELQTYYEKTKIIGHVAKRYGVARGTIKKWLHHYEIPQLTHKEACAAHKEARSVDAPNKEVLYRLHHDDGCSIADLRKIFSVGQETVYSWFKKYNLQPRSLSEACSLGKENQFEHLIIDRGVLEEYTKTHTLHEGCAHFCRSRSYLNKLSHEYGITWKKHSPKWRSKGEIELFEYCESMSPHLSWDHSNRKIIPPFELDIVCEEKKLAIEYCGIYYHSQDSGEKEPRYHQNKWRLCREAGYELLTIFESDDPEKVKNLISYKLGLCKRIYARKCALNKITSKEAAKFHEKYHLSGSVPASLNFGLFYEGKLVQVASFAKSRFNKKYEYECTRMCSANVCVLGGTSRLFKMMENESLITYADLRFGNGRVYDIIGMERSPLTPPVNYHYFHKKNREKLYSRNKFQKHKLKDMNIYDESMTEWEIMKANGYDRIHDCGSSVFTKEKSVPPKKNTLFEFSVAIP